MTASEWNEWYRPGHPVVVRLDDGSDWQTNTRSEAWTLPSGHDVVQLKGKSGSYALSRVRAMETHSL
jgi:hypothetical protein